MARCHQGPNFTPRGFRKSVMVASVHNTIDKCHICDLFNSEDDYKKLMDPMLKLEYQSLPPLWLVCSFLQVLVANV